MEVDPIEPVFRSSTNMTVHTGMEVRQRNSYNENSTNSNNLDILNEVPEAMDSERNLEWPQSFQPRLRKIMRREWMKQLFSDVRPELKQEDRMKKITTYLKQVENRVLELSTSQDNYLELLAQKTVKFKRYLYENQLEYQPNSSFNSPNEVLSNILAHPGSQPGITENQTIHEKTQQHTPTKNEALGYLIEPSQEYISSTSPVESDSQSVTGHEEELTEQRIPSTSPVESDSQLYSQTVTEYEEEATEQHIPLTSPAESDSQPLTADEVRNKSTQHYILMYLHTQHCIVQEQCPIPCCENMKFCLVHMEDCWALENCFEPYCFGTDMAVTHWKYCISEKCQICSPLRMAANQSDEIDRLLMESLHLG